MKLLQALAVAALVAPGIVSLPTTTAGSPCEDAVFAFQEAFAASGLQWNMNNAQLLAAAVDACGLPPVDPGPSPELNATINAAQAEINEAVVNVAATAAPILARDCGATSVPPLNVENAKITILTTRTIPTIGPVGPNATIEEQWGPATATYDPNSDLTSYSARGTTGENGTPPKWGFDAWNAGSATAGIPNWPQGYGIVYLYGVPIPAVYPAGYGTAKAGCTEDTLGTVCWARGEARVWLLNVYKIEVFGDFSTC